MENDLSPIDELARDCLAFRVRVLGRVITAAYDRALAPSGLTIAQGNLLVFIGKVGGCPPARIAAGMQMERSTVSRNIQPLLEAGLLEADTSPAGRVRMIRLTEAGRAAIGRAMPLWRQAQQEVTALLGEAGVRALTTLADTIGVPRAPAPAPDSEPTR